MTSPAPSFPGEDFVPARDAVRLFNQLQRVRNLMLDGRARTVAEIAALTGDPETSVSAQLRHMRKAQYGSYVVDKRIRTAPALYEYFVTTEASSTVVAERQPSGVTVISHEVQSSTVASQRYTTSSRQPGRVIHGTVRVEVRKLETCGKCKGRWFGGTVHSPHYNRSGVLVDCSGEVVR